MLKSKRNPYGYKNLLAYKKAEELMGETVLLTDHFPRNLEKLKDQMDRSARSTKQNIVEGWKRNSTREYYEFLGYSLAANAELEEDCGDIITGKYRILMGLRGVIGEKGVEIEKVENLRFYPLNKNLPPVVRLKLRCKELNFLLDRLQQSLIEKMEKEQTLSVADRRQINRNLAQEAEQWYQNILKEKGFVRLENGRVIKREEWEKGAKREKLWEER